MGVAKQARGRGAGLLLVRAIIDRAQSMGFERIFLETNSRLLPAVSIYRKVGFQQIVLPSLSAYQRADTYMELALTNYAKPLV